MITHKFFQFIIGDNLDACLEALSSKTKDTLHLLERININLQIQKSIVPTAVTLAQFKVSGTLPSLQVNISDTKYKSLMRLIDVAIPKFEDNSPSGTLPPKGFSTDFQLPILFGRGDEEYHVDYDEYDSSKVESKIEGVFFNAQDRSLQVNCPDVVHHYLKLLLQQHIFEVDFKVDNLRAVISKFGKDGSDKLIGDLHLEGFFLTFAMTDFVMKVDLNLRSFFSTRSFNIN